MFKIRYYNCEICGERIPRSGEKRRFLAKFPLDEIRCKMWIKYTGNEDLLHLPVEKLHSKKYVCGSHFAKKYFNSKKNRLKKNAIPTKNLLADPLPDNILKDSLYKRKRSSSMDSFEDNVIEDNLVDSPPKRKMYEQDLASIPVSSTSEQILKEHDYHMKINTTESPKERALYNSVPSASEQILKEHDYHMKINTTESPKERALYNSVPSASEQILKEHDYHMKINTTESPKERALYNSVPSASEQILKQRDYYTKTNITQSHKERVSSTSGHSTSNNILLDHGFGTKKKSLPCKRNKSSTSDLAYSPRKRKLLNKLKTYRQKIKQLRRGNIIPSIKSLALRTLIKASLRNQGRKRQGKRWSSTDKTLAMALYKKSPRAYRHLQKIIDLPSSRTLHTILQKIELEPGINLQILQHLKATASKLNENDKICSLLFDEMALKKRLIYNPRSDKVEGFVDLGDQQYRSADIANHALVFMIQGLHKKIKQPIAYYFVKGTISSQSLAALIKQIIIAVNSTGFKILSTVCDQGPTNIGGLNLLKEWCGIPTNLNYFYLDSSKIYIIFDVPHLFKSLRNNFHGGGEIMFDGKKGKWLYITEVAEKNQNTFRFRNLTALHVNPKFKTKMKVKFAAQILSHTVAVILKLMAEYCGDNLKAHEILETAQIVEDLDRLFDCTNGPSSKMDIIKHRRENVSKKTNHLELWKSYKKKISTMYFLKSDSFLKLKNVRCINGYITTLSSLEDIWKYVELKGFKYLNLRQLNQDCLENLFGMIRQHCPTNPNPTCHHFISALKSNFITKLSTQVGEGANCERDNNEALINFEDFLRNVDNQKNASKSVLQTTAHVATSVECDEVPTLHISENLHDSYHDPELSVIESSLFQAFDKQPTVYVAGYLASVVLKNLTWKCTSCNISLKIENPEECSSPLYKYIELREWWPDKRSLTYPTVNLCKLVDTVTICFETEIKPILHENNISQQAVTCMLAKFDNLLWVCSDHRDSLLQTLLLRLSHLLVRTECHRINLSFAVAEESIAEYKKIAQQKGVPKYTN